MNAWLPTVLYGLGLNAYPADAPPLSQTSGTGRVPLRARYKQYEEYQRRLALEYDRKLAEAVRKAHLEQEEDEFAAGLAAGVFED